MADLTDMKRTAADKKAEQERWNGGPSEQEDYPYGLTIQLDDASIKKLGLGDLDAGEPVTVCAEGTITEDSVRTVGGKTMRSMSIQLRKIEITQGDDAETIEETMYGK